MVLLLLEALLGVPMLPTLSSPALPTLQDSASPPALGVRSSLAECCVRGRSLGEGGGRCIVNTRKV
jgi:hypothetical protein